MYKVFQNITGNSPTGETIDVNWYNGDSLAQAITAMAGAASDAERPDPWYTINSVRLEVEA